MEKRIYTSREIEEERIEDFEEKTFDIPNCNLCKWREQEIDCDDNKIIFNMCSAIGCDLCVNVYNKKLCRKLYFKARRILIDEDY
jgi:hypothetical protein